MAFSTRVEHVLMFGKSRVTSTRNQPLVLQLKRVCEDSGLTGMSDLKAICKKHRKDMLFQTDAAKAVTQRPSPPSAPAFLPVACPGNDSNKEVQGGMISTQTDAAKAVTQHPSPPSAPESVAVACPGNDSNKEIQNGFLSDHTNAPKAEKLFLPRCSAPSSAPSACSGNDAISYVTSFSERLQRGICGGKQQKHLDCAVCKQPRHEMQKGKVCPLCVKWCRKVCGHQRLSQLLAEEENCNRVAVSSLAELRSKP